MGGQRINLVVQICIIVPGIGLLYWLFKNSDYNIKIIFKNKKNK